mmetsp:Transcript_72167/g.161502  ORF Transcript_72167/g.161502 Transcript_72167/m.161502 type:complete len:215 (+) Transcript_72167:376-1020(+)
MLSSRFSMVMMPRSVTVSLCRSNNSPNSWKVKCGTAPRSASCRDLFWAISSKMSSRSSGRKPVMLSNSAHVSSSCSILWNSTRVTRPSPLQSRRLKSISSLALRSSRLKAASCWATSSLCSSVTFAMLSLTTAVRIEKMAQFVTIINTMKTYLVEGTSVNNGSKASRSAFMAMKRLKMACGMSSKVALTASGSAKSLGNMEPLPTSCTPTSAHV